MPKFTAFAFRRISLVTKFSGTLKISLASLHMFEEPCISGTNGSGTVFFTNCNLNCIYCQNHEISQERKR